MRRLKVWIIGNPGKGIRFKVRDSRSGADLPKKPDRKHQEPECHAERTVSRLPTVPARYGLWYGRNTVLRVHTAGFNDLCIVFLHCRE
jgi:hypothetical protein